MTELQIKSWILLSTAYASENRPASYYEISQMADGINHAIPSHKELQKSLRYLVYKGMVVKQGRKYSATNYGKNLLDKAKTNTDLILKIWENLEGQLKELNIETGE